MEIGEPTNALNLDIQPLSAELPWTTQSHLRANPLKRQGYVHKQNGPRQVLGKNGWNFVRLDTGSPRLIEGTTHKIHEVYVILTKGTDGKVRCGNI